MLGTFAALKAPFYPVFIPESTLARIAYGWTDGKAKLNIAKIFLLKIGVYNYQFFFNNHSSIPLLPHPTVLNFHFCISPVIPKEYTGLYFFQFFKTGPCTLVRVARRLLKITFLEYTIFLHFVCFYFLQKFFYIIICYFHKLDLYLFLICLKYSFIDIVKNNGNILRSLPAFTRANGKSMQSEFGIAGKPLVW